jgi:hypothetical protein
MSAPPAMENPMDDKSKTGGLDRVLISLSEDYEVAKAEDVRRELGGGR